MGALSGIKKQITRWRDSSERKMIIASIIEDWPTYTLFLAGLLAAVAAFATAARQATHEQQVNKSLGEALEKLEQANTAQGEAIAKLTEANCKLDTSAENEKQAMQLQQEANKGQARANETLEQALAGQQEAAKLLTQTIDADKEIIAKQQQVLNYFTGGDSVFYLDFKDGPDGGPFAEFAIQGTDPIPCVFLQIVDVTKAIELKKKDTPAKDIDAQCTTRIELQTIWPDSGLGTVRFPFSDADCDSPRLLDSGGQVFYATIAGATTDSIYLGYQSHCREDRWQTWHHCGLGDVLSVRSAGCSAAEQF